MNRCARCFGDLYDLVVFCPHCTQAHDPDFSKLIDQTIDQYRILRCLGQGGLSTVFAASNLETGDVVVLKVSDPAQLVRRELSYVIETDQARRYWSEMLERMRREAETLATISHPNIVRFYGSGMINADLRYVSMEYLRGKTLRHEIDLKRRLELSQVIHIASEISSALIEVHSRGIIHRDINPRNVMIADLDSATKLIDFGIAKFPQPPGAPPFTQYSTMTGTVAYASPEQCQSRPLDHRTDIYSLGIVLYEMLTGERPFSGRTPTEIALKQIQSDPKPPRALNPEIPVKLERALLRSLAKNPNLRHESVKELAEELHAAGKQIIISLLPGTSDDSDSNSPDNLASTEVSLESETNEELELTRKIRRFSAAAALVLLLLTVSGILLGRNLFSSRDAQSQQNQENLTVNPTVSPSATTTPNQPGMSAAWPLGSDADALEMAARQSQNNSAMVSSPTRSSTSGGAEVLLATRPLSNQAVRNEPSPRASSKNEGNSPKNRHNSVAPLPSPPMTNPQAPEPSLPEIVANRDQKPESEPDLTQAPRRKEPEAGPALTDRENPSVNQPQRRSEKYRDRDRDRDGDFDRRRLPREEERDDRRGDDWEEEAERIGPQLIQWRGRVDYVRLIKLEMPGVPGMIEIPKIYRDRVGVVEPPSDNNDWRSAVLRIFGRGRVSILVRWWPLSRKAGNYSMRR